MGAENGRLRRPPGGFSAPLGSPPNGCCRPLGKMPSTAAAAQFAASKFADSARQFRDKQRDGGVVRVALHGYLEVEHLAYGLLGEHFAGGAVGD